MGISEFPEILRIFANIIFFEFFHLNFHKVENLIYKIQKILQKIQLIRQTVSKPFQLQTSFLHLNQKNVLKPPSRCKRISSFHISFYVHWHTYIIRLRRRGVPDRQSIMRDQFIIPLKRQRGWLTHAIHIHANTKGTFIFLIFESRDTSSRCRDLWSTQHWTTNWFLKKEGKKKECVMNGAKSMKWNEAKRKKNKNKNKQQE